METVLAIVYVFFGLQKTVSQLRLVSRKENVWKNLP